VYQPGEFVNTDKDQLTLTASEFQLIGDIAIFSGFCTEIEIFVKTLTLNTAAPPVSNELINWVV